MTKDTDHISWCAIADRFGTEFIRSVVRQAWLKGRQAPGEGGILKKLFSKRKTSGFRPGRIPDAIAVKLLEEDVAAFPILSAAVLRAWAFTEPELRDAVSALLVEREERVHDLDGLPKVPANTLLENWHEMLDLAALAAERIEGYEPEAVRLMLLLLLDRTPSVPIDSFEPDGSPSFEEEPQSPAVDGKAFVPGPFERWLSEARVLPAQSEEWGRVDSFVNALRTIADEKAAERERNSKSVLRSEKALGLLGTLRGELAEWVSFFEATDALGRLAELDDYSDAVIEALEACVAAYRTYGQAKMLPDRTAKEHRDKIAAEGPSLDEAEMATQALSEILPRQETAAIDEPASGSADKDRFDVSYERAVVDVQDDDTSVGTEESKDAEGGSTSEEAPEDTAHTVVEAEPSACQDVTESASVELPEASYEPICVVDEESSRLWRLIGDGRLDTAYHLARCRQMGPPSSPRPWVLKACVVSPWVQSDLSELAMALRDAFGAFEGPQDFVRGADDFNQAVRFLLWGASLRPALLAPLTGVSTVLRDLHMGQGLEVLFEVSTAFADHAATGIAIPIGSLHEQASGAEIDRLLGEVREEAETLRHRLSSARLSYQRATIALKRWLDIGNTIDSLISPIEEDEVERAGAILQRARRYRDPLACDEEIRRVWNQDLGFDGEVLYRAHRQLVSSLQTAAALAERWASLRSGGDEAAASHVRTALGKIQRLVSSKERTVTNALKGAASMDGSAAAAARFALNQWAGVCDLLLKGLAKSRSFEPSLRVLVAGECILDSSVAFDDGGDATGEALYERLRPLCEASPRPRESFREVVETDAPDLIRAEEMLLWMEQTDWVGSEEASSMRSEIQEADARHRQRLLHDTRQLRGRLATAVAQGVISEDQHVGYASVLSEIEAGLEDSGSVDHPFFQETIAMIETELRLGKDRALGEIRKRLESLPSLSEGDRARIESALAVGDALTAMEYVERLSQGLTLPDDADDAPDGVSFEQVARQLLELKLDNMRPKVLDALRSGRTLGPLEFGDVRGAMRKEAELVMTDWYASKQTNRLSESQLKGLLRFLGFGDADVTLYDTQGLSAKVSVRALEDKEICPLRTFGSEAAGIYTVQSHWGRRSIDDLLNRLDAPFRPTIVLYFGFLTDRERRELAIRSRVRERSHLVVDEALMLYLCAQRDSRLATLFHCTLPYGFHEPFVTTSGRVPPEMFYGRSSEIRAIREGRACLVYGGRQLGKTALLREVERQMHSLPDSVAVWVDLKDRGIGISAPPEEVWSLLRETMSRYGICKPASRNPGKDRDAFEKEVKEWLAQPNRSILLLLDEADRFLDEDRSGADPYQNTQRLWVLTQATHRRFKVVLAGLHDVLRMTKDWNHPLGQLGQPICIGPLLNNGEAKAARELIRRPLEAAGYKLESVDLETRILAQTNYYPSLIQIYCEHLLRRIHSGDIPIPDRQSLPYTITERMVTAAYDGELRDWMRRKFDLTLNLDSRYRLIALAIALESVDSARVTQHGLTIRRIEELAREWWPQGFPSAPADGHLAVLLDEMVGLGVLRRTQSGYAIRNANVAAILGGKKSIELGLEQFIGEPAPEKFDRSTARRVSSVGSNPSRLVPMTAQQEQLLGEQQSRVFVVYGTPASDIESLKLLWKHEFAERKKAKSTVRVEIMSGSSDPAGFSRELQQTARLQSVEATLVVVPESVPWSDRWVEEAERLVSGLRSQRLLRKVVFLAGTDHARFMSAQPVRDRVIEIQLGAWTPSVLRNWLRENQLPDSADEVARWMAETGGWPSLVYSKVAGESQEGRDTLSKSFGIGLFERNVLLTLAIAEPDLLAAEEVPHLSRNLSGATTESVVGVLEWACLLGIATPGVPTDERSPAANRYRLDPYLKNLLLESDL